MCVQVSVFGGGYTLKQAIVLLWDTYPVENGWNKGERAGNVSFCGDFFFFFFFFFLFLEGCTCGQLESSVVHSMHKHYIFTCTCEYSSP